MATSESAVPEDVSEPPAKFSVLCHHQMQVPVSFPDVGLLNRIQRTDMYNTHVVSAEPSLEITAGAQFKAVPSVADMMDCV